MDELILRVVNGWAAHPLVEGFGTVLSSRWMIAAVGLPTAIILLRRGRRYWAVLSIALAMGAGDLTTARVLKPIFDRERPCRALDGLVEAARCGSGRSFPSGHATVAFAFLVSAAPVVRAGWLILTPVAAGVAGSRVLLGVHYPSDVAAGALVGSFIGWLGGRLRRRLEREPAEDAPPPEP